MIFRDAFPRKCSRKLKIFTNKCVNIQKPHGILREGLPYHNHDQHHFIHAGILVILQIYCSMLITQIYFAKGSLTICERNFCYASNLWLHLQFRLLTMVNWGIYVTECPLGRNPSPPIPVIGPLIYATAMFSCPCKSAKYYALTSN